MEGLQKYISEDGKQINVVEYAEAVIIDKTGIRIKTELDGDVVIPADVVRELLEGRSLNTVMRQTFRAGDEVPQWIQKTHNVTATFLVDAEAYVSPSGSVRLYPVHPFPENGDSAAMSLSTDGETPMTLGALIKAERIDPEVPAYLAGAPTMFFRYPKDDERNTPKPLVPKEFLK